MRTPALPYKHGLKVALQTTLEYPLSVNAALDHAPLAAHRDVIDFPVVARDRSFDEVSPLSQIDPIAESSPFGLDS